MTTLTSPSEATPLVPKLVALGVLLIDGHCPLFPPQLIGSLLNSKLFNLLRCRCRLNFVCNIFCCRGGRGSWFGSSIRNGAWVNALVVDRCLLFVLLSPFRGSSPLRIRPWPLVTESTAPRAFASTAKNRWQVLSGHLFEKFLLVAAS